MAETLAGPRTRLHRVRLARPRPTDLAFVRKSMVRWFDPPQLIDAAVRVLLSGVFSSYPDNRELQAREPAGQLDRSGRNSRCGRNARCDDGTGGGSSEGPHRPPRRRGGRPGKGPIAHGDPRCRARGVWARPRRSVVAVGTVVGVL